MKMIDLIDANFTEIKQFENLEKWHELRRTGIGGSDAGAIMGLNKYSSPLIIYFQKKGIEGFKGNASTKWGHILENPIRQETAKELDIEIVTVDGMFTSKEYPFMNANVDGLISIPDNHILCLSGSEVTGIGGHEIKTSSRGVGFTDDEIPDSYYCQVQHYMAVTKLNWFVLTAFIDLTKEGKHYLIKRDEEFIQKLINTEKEFWENNVLKDVIPEPLGIDEEAKYLKQIPLNENIILDNEVESIIDEEQTLLQQKKKLEQQIEVLKNKIICKMIENSNSNNSENTMATAGKYKISYTKNVRKIVDTTALKKDLLFEKYVKESVSKTLRIGVNK